MAPSSKSGSTGSTSGRRQTRCSFASAVAICAPATRSPCALATAGRARPAFGCKQIARSAWSSRHQWMRSPPMSSPSCRSSPPSPWFPDRRRLESNLAIACGRRGAISPGVLAEDMWGNPTTMPSGRDAHPSRPVRGLPGSIAIKRGEARGCWKISSPRPPAISTCGSWRTARRFAAPIRCGPCAPRRCGATGAIARPERRDHWHGLGGKLFPLCAGSPSSTAWGIRATTFRSPMRSGTSSTG